MGIDRKYGRVTTERGTIGEDEPVVLFRAQDKLLPRMLGYYRELCQLNGSPPHHLNGIANARAEIREWQEDHHTQVPRSDRHPESES